MNLGKSIEEKYFAHKIFAWYPIRLDNGRWVWLEYVMKSPLKHNDGTFWRNLWRGIIWKYEKIK